MEIIKYNKARFEKNKLTIYEDITIDEWKELGQGLRQVEGSVQFWIGDWARYGDKRGFTGKYTDPKVYDELENITGLNRGTIQNYKSVAERTSSLRSEDLTFNHHKEVASLPPEKQEIFLNKAVEENLSVRALREEIRRDKVEKSFAELPSGKYRVFYADPPWEYGNSMPSYFTEQADHYQLMSLDEICSLDIKSLTEDDAVLFLWVTSPMLRDSFKVVDAWGFNYKTSFIWDKVKHNMGHYNSVRHEILLVCTKGACTPDNIKLYDSVQSIERTEHSSKPEIFRNIIDTLYTHGRRIELFARNKAEGWDVFGNEA